MRNRLARCKANLATASLDLSADSICCVEIARPDRPADGNRRPRLALSQANGGAGDRDDRTWIGL